jgi:hypothetical protein
VDILREEGASIHLDYGLFNDAVPIEVEEEIRT